MPDPARSPEWLDHSPEYGGNEKTYSVPVEEIRKELTMATTQSKYRYRHPPRGDRRDQEASGEEQEPFDRKYSRTLQLREDIARPFPGFAAPVEPER
jgi:hypothetical protein